MKGRRPGCIAIVSEHDDLHALAAKKELERYGDIVCHVIESDRVCQGDGVAWTEGEGHRDLPLLPVKDHEPIDIRNVNSIWFRRFYVPQSLETEVPDPDHMDMIEGSAWSALMGILLTDFKGTWISDPFATRAAENKLYQMRVARRVGFHVPRTLISNNPKTIRRFCSDLEGRVVIKSLRPSDKMVLLTQRIRPEHLESSERLRLSPAIYQEYIPGQKHLCISGLDYIGRPGLAWQHERLV
ncbi:ATP-grasp domain-containing protein [Streptomyces phaeoluteigriseus]|uniref:ATP-grasp domain-containing protein n=1 Tax=Streptomyces phaeoluteigriseus TaxID=114686 RepID=UPI0036CDC0C1